MGMYRAESVSRETCVRILNELQFEPAHHLLKIAGQAGEIFSCSFDRYSTYDHIEISLVFIFIGTRLTCMEWGTYFLMKAAPSPETKWSNF